MDSTLHRPDVTVASRWVAVRFNERSPHLVLDDTGTGTERWTLPNAIATLPIPPAGRTVRTGSRLAADGGAL
jgi:hypothetical protein